MRIETKQVTQMHLSEVQALDPITVTLEDIGPREGKITIECYGKAWSSYWGGMGSSTIAQFFCRCDEHYLAKNLSSTPSSITDYEGIAEMVRAKIREDITRVKYGDRHADVPSIEDEASLQANAGFLGEVLGDEWWRELPEKANPDYLYLCRIISAVQEGLQSVSTEAAT